MRLELTAEREAQRGGLLADVLENPADDAPRLIFADWLEEYGGEPERAEFVRVQVELAKPLEADWTPAASDLERFDADTTRSLYDLNNWQPLQRQNMLRGRERELLVKHGAAWRAVVAELLEDWNPKQAARPSVVDNDGAIVFRRGFVAKVATTCALWLEHGSTLVRAQPLEVVRLIDRDPTGKNQHHSEPFGWYGRHDLHDEDDLPVDLWELLFAGRHSRINPLGKWRFYDIATDAYADLSRACLLWAKGERR